MGRKRHLPVVTGCDRRTLLHGIALGALGLIGCRMSLDSEAQPDGGTPPLDTPPDPGFESCGDELCFDLAHPTNQALREVAGARVVTASPRKLVVVRTSETEFVALSAICTHNGCTVRFVAASDNLQCPCHGSNFTLDGVVTAGPAERPLDVFPTTFDTATQLLTIRV